MKDLDLFIGDKYKYSNNILRSSDKIEITCPKHGIFLQRPHDHYINRNGCPRCGRSKATKTSEKWEEQIKKVWNDTYEYLDKYTLQHTLIRIKCHQHGIFQLKPKVHLRGRGCPKCSKENKLHNGCDTCTIYNGKLVELKSKIQTTISEYTKNIALAKKAEKEASIAEWEAGIKAGEAIRNAFSKKEAPKNDKN